MKENKCKICNGTYSIDVLDGDSHSHLIIENTLFHWDSILGYEGEVVHFCFACGRNLQKTVKE